MLDRGDGLDAVIVGDEGGEAGIGDPIEEALVAPVQHRAEVMRLAGVGSRLHLEEHLGKAGVDAAPCRRLSISTLSSSRTRISRS